VQPILVRPAPIIRSQGLNGATVAGKTYFGQDQIEEAARTHFEVVAGERRVLAARQAGLEEITATVRDLTDEQVLELQLIENLQRQDLHELAEAEGYEALQQLGHTVDDMAAKVGKSKATLYARMKLLALGPEGRKAFYDGKLSASTALLVARIPLSLQKQALTEITKLNGYGDEKEPMSARQAQRFIHENYMLRLADAGFKTGDATLVPSAGACGPCPKRTGNQPQLFGDVKGADVCTDPICFKQKIKAHAERAIAEAAETGQKVLSGPAAKKVARNGVDYSLDGYVRLDARDYDRNGTYRQTLGKGYVPTLLQDPDTGKMIEVAPNKDVDKARADGKRSSGSERDSYSAKQRAVEKKHRFEVSYRVALFKAVHIADSSRKTLTRREMDTVADRLLSRLDHDSKKRLFAALGWEARKQRGGYGVELDPPTPIEKMTDEQVAQLVRDCSLAHELQVWQHSGETRPKDLEAAAVALDVDAKKIRRDLEAAAKEKAAGKGKKAAPAKASKKKARK
jgi:ParB/RepB/Spo0J family partition protein